jgi:predicted ribosome quality control (RQC) complex YloA/Tae2 family protein
MDGLSFHKLLKLLDRKYKNAVLNRLSAEGSAIYLSLYKDGAASVLSFSAANPPTFAKVSVAIGESAGALKALAGSVITAFEGRSYDRLGYIRLNRRKPSGKTDCFTLVLEPMGRHANAFLLNSAGMILFNLTVKSIDSDRDIGVGKIYLPPKVNKIFSLDKLAQGVSFLEYLGFYPATAKIADSMAQTAGFEKTVEYLKEELNNGCRFYRDTAGRLFPFQDTNSSLEEIEFERLAQVSANKGGGDERFISEKLLRFYAKGLARYESAGRKLAEELSAALGWENVRGEAELVKANIYNIKGKGMYNLVHYGEREKEMKPYFYNSDKPPLKYMEELFKKAGKLRRSIPHINKRLAEVTQLEHAAREQIYFIGKADPSELKEIFQILNKDRGGKVSKQDFHRFEYNDSVIYIGKNSASNHRLVFRFAKQDDIWLHAHNIPSAHVIIRTDGGRVREDTILFAAGLAAHFSKNSGEKSVEVDYTLRKYVKKPPNTPPGYVTYTHYKTVKVAPNNQCSL